MFMILFLIKKTFCDGWDNLLSMAVWNIFMIACFIGGWFGLSAVIPPEGANFIQSLPAIGVMIAVLALCMIPVFAANEVTSRLADFKSVKLLDFFKAFPAVYKDAIPFGILIALIILLVSSAFPFYWNLWRSGSFLGLFLVALIFWTTAITILALQWYMPLKAQMKGGFFKTLKKCFLVYFDNANFSFFMFLYILVQLVFSAVMLVFTIHGVSGIVLSLNNALRLRLYKYDWMEEHPEITPAQARKQIPWGELIAKDKEILGPRNFQSFLYPWK